MKKIKIKLTTLHNNPLDGTFKVWWTNGYLSRSGFTAISIRMDPDSDYAIRTSIRPLAEYPRRRAQQTPDLCFAEMASSWLHPVFYIHRGLVQLDRLPPTVPALRNSIRCLQCPFFETRPLLWLPWLGATFGPNLFTRTVKQWLWISSLFLDNLITKPAEQLRLS